MAQRTFLAQLKELRGSLENLTPAILKEAAADLVNLSPDDTGAYLLSHSIGRSGNVGRRISSDSRISAPNTHRQEALDRLLGQVAAIPPNSTRIFIGNNAPHASAVEGGGYGWKSPGHFVYQRFRESFPSIVKKAIQSVGLK